MSRILRIYYVETGEYADPRLTGISRLTKKSEWWELGINVFGLKFEIPLSRKKKWVSISSDTK